MRKYTLLLAIMLSATATRASEPELFMDAGLGAFSTEGPTLATVKFARIGEQDALWSALKERFNVGGWLDQRSGYTNSAFAGYQLGFDVKNDLFEMGIFSGPASSPLRTKRCGHFQFNETVFFGIRSPKSDDSIGIAYNHFSSAGLEMPNLGKDFVCLEVKMPL